MNKQTVEVLEKRALALFEHIGANCWHAGWDLLWKESPELVYRIEAPGHIVFRPKNHPDTTHHQIVFKNIQPKNITKQVYHPPILTNTVIGDLNSSKITNDSDSELTRTYTVSEGSESHMEEEAGVAVGIAIRQLIGYGGEVAQVKGETEISVSVDAHYNKSWGSSNSKGVEISNTVTVPPKTEIDITTKKSVSDFKQKAEYWCDLDHSVIMFGRHGDSNFHHEYNDMDEFEQNLRGFGLHNHPSTWQYKNYPWGEGFIQKFVGSLDLHFETELKFSNASTGNVRVTERKL